MLIQVHESVWVGDMDACLPIGGEGTWQISTLRWPEGGAFAGIVHAAKHPCHVRAVNYKGSLPKDHPEYLVARRASRIGRPNHLILNLIDAPIPTLFRPEVFLAALNFLDERVGQGMVVIHCNQGYSRAPSLALLWLAKREKAIPRDSWDAAKVAFLKLMPDFAPGKGIEGYLGQTWNELA